MDITCYTFPYIPLHRYPWCSGLRPRPCRISCRQNIYFCLIRRLIRQKYHISLTIRKLRAQHQLLAFIWLTSVTSIDSDIFKPFSQSVNMPFVTVWQASFIVSEIAKRVLEKHDMEDYPSSDGVEKVLHPNLTLSEFSKSEKKPLKSSATPAVR